MTTSSLVQTLSPTTRRYRRALGWHIYLSAVNTFWFLVPVVLLVSQVTKAIDFGITELPLKVLALAVYIYFFIRRPTVWVNSEGIGFSGAFLRRRTIRWQDISSLGAQYSSRRGQYRYLRFDIQLRENASKESVEHVSAIHSFLNDNVHLHAIAHRKDLYDDIMESARGHHIRFFSLSDH